eukprot:SAG25_NODE_12338_length_282_cov_0.617486_1_plen_39_part_01
MHALIVVQKLAAVLDRSDIFKDPPSLLCGSVLVADCCLA